MDFCGPFPTGETVFVVIDSYSKFPEVEIMKSTTASAVTNRLDRMFAVHGIPFEIYSNNGPPFASDAVKKFMRYRGINHVPPCCNTLLTTGPGAALTLFEWVGGGG
jgi:hypothetical protein